MTSHPKRLIEVDLPIKRISAHSRREKSIRQGHISTLHIWWARRPLAACRAVTCAALWPDPADPACPAPFREAAKRLLLAWTPYDRQKLLSEDSRPRFDAARKNPARFDDLHELRAALLDFIADFANWDNAGTPEFLDTARELTRVAHEGLGGIPGTRPLVVDHFAGGGSIPLEALRVGADSFASDINPIPVLLNRMVLEHIPKFGLRLAEAVRTWGQWIKEQAEADLARFYPKDPDGAVPIAYLWARTIQCEGPGCGAEVPLVRGLWLSKKAGRPMAMRIVPHREERRVGVELFTPSRKDGVGQGTVKRGSATCPCCGYTTAVARVRDQLTRKQGGADQAMLLAVVTTRPGRTGRFYRLPTADDLAVVAAAQEELARRSAAHEGTLPLVPDEPTPQGGGSGAGRAFSQRNYGMNRFADLFTARQSLAMTTLARLVVEAGKQEALREAPAFAEAMQTVLALALSRIADRCSALCTWRPQADQEKVEHVFTRQALPITWDFAEGTPLSDGTAGWSDAYEPPAKLVESVAALGLPSGHVEQCSATAHVLPDDSAQALITDPPYYDAVPYADLSDFFYVWLKRALPGGFHDELTPKADECIVDEMKGKDQAYFERTMGQAMAEGRRVLAPDGVGVVVFAHKSTAGWEAQLQAMCDAGWIVTGSWPIDTELGNRLRAMDSAALASSVHIVVRPRENSDGSVRADDVGDWRDVLEELPRRIHDWMPRLAAEGVVGADAIFACLGPALEIFSRYARVEKASGEILTLREYLEHVWAAVAKEALSMVFRDADTAGFEPDARLTAMWLWTLGAGLAAGTEADEDDGGGDESDGGDDDAGGKKAKPKGFVLEYDAARKIAQGLGASLETMPSLIEMKGETARLLPVAERTAALFGKEQPQLATARARKKEMQLTLALFEELKDERSGEAAWRDKATIKLGDTTLDRVHQSMILFATGRGDAMKRFLVEDGAGRDQRFWKLANALSALYPPASDEKRWVDGVLARKKGLGL